jgi:RNA polymerase sigma-70 factor, ECF subfamily
MRDLESSAATETTESGSWTDERRSFWRSMKPRLWVYLDSFSAFTSDAKDDILQRTLIAFWQHSSHLEADARSWLFRVVRNAALDFLRSKGREDSRRAESKAEFDQVAALPSPYPHPEEHALKAEEESFLGSFLASLKTLDRELLHLAFAEDLRYEEIARLLGLPLGTVKWKIHSLKRALAARYQKEFGHGNR